MDNIDLVLVARGAEWQYRLDAYTDEQLEAISAIAGKARKDLGSKLDKGKLTEWSKERTMQALEEAGHLLDGAREQMTACIAGVAATAGSAAYDAHSNILSFDGAATEVKSVAMTADQLYSMIKSTPVGGHTLSEWVDRSFDYSMQKKIKSEIAAGMMSGESYKELANRLKECWPGTIREMETLTRTYVQSVNVQAMQDVYEANADIVKSVVWRATFGLRTCILCAGLDGHEYPVTIHPPCPLHPRCRCVLIPTVVGANGMGLSAKQINEMAKPYSIKNGKIGLGGGKVISAGTFKGDFGQWMKTTTPAQQRELLGPSRLDAITSGKVRFEDLVDKNTGRLRTLDELGLGVKRSGKSQS